MKNRLAMLLCFSVCAANSFSQVQFNGSLSYLQGTGYYQNHAYLIGAGISGKYMIAERFFVGATVRTYKANTTAYENYNAQDRLHNFSGNLDIILKKKDPVQLYIGFAAGISTATHMINWTRVYKDFNIYSFKAGAHVKLGKSTGLFAECQYNHTPGDGKPSDIPGLDARNTVITEPISGYITFDAGLYVRLYMRK